MQHIQQPPMCMARKRQQGVHTRREAPNHRSPPAITTRSGKAAAGPGGAKSRLGRGSVLPNLYWTSVPLQQLRQYHPRFVGLPPVGKDTRSIVDVYSGLASSTWQPPVGTATDEATAVTLNEAARGDVWRAKRPETDLPAGGLWEGGPGVPAALRKRQVCESVALQGPLACRLHWGNVQEASGLYAVAQIFPGSLIEQIGLLAVDLAGLPPAWSASNPNASLPALGASPDALIMHWLQIGPQQLEAARQSLTQDSTASEAAAAALELVFAALDALTLGPNAEDVDGAPSSMSASQQQPVPLTRSNDDALKWLSGVLLGQESASGPGACGYVAPDGTAVLAWREVVEVKNSCPFALKELRKARKGQTMLRYITREHEPAQEPRPEWLPQVQWHCLAAGMQSCLLVTRTASKGVTVFRVRRDDAWLMHALHLVRRLHTDYSARGQAPPRDVMRNPEVSPLHQAVRAATTELTRHAALVVTRPGHRLRHLPDHLPQPPGSDRNSIWVVQDA